MNMHMHHHMHHEEIFRLLREGTPKAAIARAVGLPRTTLRNYLKRHTTTNGNHANGDPSPAGDTETTPMPPVDCYHVGIRFGQFTKAAARIRRVPGTKTLYVKNTLALQAKRLFWAHHQQESLGPDDLQILAVELADLAEYVSKHFLGASLVQEGGA